MLRIIEQNETLLTALEACKHPLMQRGGRPLHRSVLQRWWGEGLLIHGQRVVLESVRHGGLRCTSAEAIERFHALLNGTPPGKPTPQSLQREHDRADAELAASGI